MFIFAIVLFLISWVSIPVIDLIPKNKDVRTSAMVALFAIMPFSVLFLIISVTMDTEKDTAIKCLKNNNPYEMHIRYEIRDSTVIPVDTVYILKK